MTFGSSESMLQLASHVLTLKTIYLTVMANYFAKCKDYKRILQEIDCFNRYPRFCLQPADLIQRIFRDLFMVAL